MCRFCGQGQHWTATCKRVSPEIGDPSRWFPFGFPFNTHPKKSPPLQNQSIWAQLAAELQLPKSLLRWTWEPAQVRVNPGNFTEGGVRLKCYDLPFKKWFFPLHVFWYDSRERTPLDGSPMLKVALHSSMFENNLDGKSSARPEYDTFFRSS